MCTDLTEPSGDRRQQYHCTDKPRGSLSTRMPTYLQRLEEMADSEEQNLSWKTAVRWAKQRTPDHEVHMGGEESILLFQTYQLDNAKTYDDSTLREMANFFVFARQQYAAFMP